MAERIESVADYEVPNSNDFDATTTAIMEAVHDAIVKHGYPNLTMAHIAAEFDRSKSLLYYHYDGKEELLEDFFAYICAAIEADLDAKSPEEPVDRLFYLIDRILPPELSEGERQYRQALFEVRSQAPHNAACRAEIMRTDDMMIAALTETIREGVEAGDFSEVDPETWGEIIFATLFGIMERGVMLEDDAFMRRNREMLIQRIDRVILADE